MNYPYVDLIRCFEKGSVAEKGNCMEAIEYVTKEYQEFAENCLDFVIEPINDKAPRVKCESADTLLQALGRVERVGFSFGNEIKTLYLKRGNAPRRLSKNVGGISLLNWCLIISVYPGLPYTLRLNPPYSL